MKEQCSNEFENINNQSDIKGFSAALENEMRSMIKAQEVVFKREKVSAVMQMSKDCIVDLKFDLGQTSENYISDTLTARLTGHIYSNTIDERRLKYKLEPPTFLDWLFRRRKEVEFDFKAKDLMISPPRGSMDNILRCYEISSLE